MQKFLVSADDAGTRLDAYLANKIKVLSRSSIKKLCQDGKIKVNNQAKPVKYKVNDGDSIEVEFDPKDLKEIPNINLEILYEDNDCLVINKPTGVLSHSKGNFNPEATVATFIRPYLTELEGERAGIVHRLDRATSGVMICAKNFQSLGWLQKQFSKRKVKKTYIAQVSGNVTPKEAIIDKPIARNPKNPKTFHISSTGKPAKTNYKVIEIENEVTTLELRPETGRTHQLRVHLSSISHPIIGDELYNGVKNPRLLLHAFELELTLPNKTRKKFVAPIPKDFHT